jgi:transposase
VLSLPSRTTLFLFINKRRDSMQAIFRDGAGLLIWYKRLERGTWLLPATHSETLKLEVHERAMILRGIDLKSALRRVRYERPSAV